MSIMCLVSVKTIILIIFLLNYSYSINDFTFRIQPQSVLINKHDELYMTRDDHYIGQVLYQNDHIQLSCECQTELNQTKTYIYWTINNKISHRYNNSNSIQLSINANTVKIPVTYVTCYCMFIQRNSARLIKDYQYLLYIDLESEPSLKPIDYVVESSFIKQRLYHFIYHHFIVILGFLLIIFGITCPLIAFSFTAPSNWISYN